MGAYNSDLQMFVETPHEIDKNALDFISWLWRGGKLIQDGYPQSMTADEIATYAWDQWEQAA